MLVSLITKITQFLCEPLNKMAPIKLRNMRKNKNRGAKLSSEVRNLMNERDELKNRASRSNSKDDWLEWKKVKNRVNKMIRKEKNSKKDNEILKVSNDSSAKSLWNMVRNRACWPSPSSPTVLKIGENDFTSSPLKMASALNEFFISKVEKICESLSDCDLDPTITLKKVMSKWGKMGSIPNFTFKKLTQPQ